MCIRDRHLGEPGQVPASENALQRLQPTKYKKMELNPTGNETDKCMICLQEYEEDNPIIILKCSNKHYFHEECIKNWLQINGVCPACRQKI
eukprot:TRINITY_DN9711_c0_g1_i3.p2 TRINITY_DN9711_c0_g1~~TRINITY_DN9711_c0_g1_i3.p2  ORF type:complete len:104 (+),score=15.73 TRINITY_DN9711_c0_g1_i3:41-313(+)